MDSREIMAAVADSEHELLRALSGAINAEIEELRQKTQLDVGNIVFEVADVSTVGDPGRRVVSNARIDVSLPAKPS